MAQGTGEIEAVAIEVADEPAAEADPLLPKKEPLREWIPRRPAVVFAVALMAGIALHDRVPIGPGMWAIAAGVVLMVSLACWRAAWACTIGLIGATLLAGVAIAQVAAFYYAGDHIAHYATDAPRLAQLELHIDKPPRVIANAFGLYKSLPPKQVTTATVRRVKTLDGWRAGSGEILVQINQPHPRLAAGQTIRTLGRLQRPGAAMNPGQFDWANYYREQRILTSISILQPGNIENLSAGMPRPVTRFRERTRELLAAGFPAERSLDHALLRALLLGDSDPEMRDVQDQFKRTGTSHHLAISGLHVAVLSGVVLIVCRLLRLSPFAITLVVLIFVLAYGTVALPSPPVVRSVLLCLSIGVGILFRRRVDAIQLLFISVIAMLIYHPLDLYNAGFQLSFGTVLGLLLFTRPMADRLRQWRGDEPDPDFARRPRFVRWGRAFDRRLVTIFAAALVAYLISMPLIALHFEQLNPWAIPAGIVLAPVVFVALIGGFAKVLLTLAWPSAAETWAAMAAAPVAAMRHAVGWLAMLPGSDVPLPAPPLWLVLAFYGFVLLLLIPMKRPKWQMVFRFVPAGACLLAIFLPLVTGRAAAIPTTAPLRVTLLAVGAGQTAVVQTPAGRVVLVDAGSMSLGDLVRKCLGPFLREVGEREIDTILLTHGDYDHISGVADVVSAYDVRETFIGPRFRHHAAGNAPAEGMLRTLDQLDRPPRVLNHGDALPLGRDVQVEVLWPAKGSVMSSNDDALVLRMTYAGRRILFTGDIQDDAMRGLLRDPSQLKADVLIAPHHGSSERLTGAFIAAVDPRFILSSNDRTLTGKQRRLENLIGERLLYRTNECGAITVTVDESGKVEVTTFLPQRQSASREQR